ncbi:hypothetical protein ACFFSH_29625 [Streptomyces filamentosus]|uniref:Uncharacterized protein n=1 Tax=Streptomyces filamentosus TaxID=67294 RepID=A0A919BUE1_STRFL|nr:hypothetical protein [Streptomyces filamentosus]GHG12609.1 hypothetical protein GCM10017667_52600 [Streptomyces filamentosus]
MSSGNTTNQERIARALNRSTGCGYQKALQRVRAAAAAGRLPAKLDQAGRDQAVRMLAEDHAQPARAAVPGEKAAGARPEHQVGDLLNVPPADLMEAHRAMERLRGLRDKERTVAAMRAQRDQRLNPYLMPQVLEGLLERGGVGKTVTEFSELTGLLAEQQGVGRDPVVDVDPPASSLDWLRQAAALLPEPGYEPVFVDVDTLPSRAPKLTPQEKDELLRRLASDDPQ